MVFGVDEVGTRPTIRVGSRVQVRDDAGEETFRIVNAEFSDPGRRWINEASPLARALLGHLAGDVVVVRAPYGIRKVTVLGVESAGER
jgi:transcription elongation factor GreA